MKTINVTTAIREALEEEFKRDPNTVLIGEDVGKMGSALGTSVGLIDIFGPERIIDMPICEASQGSFAVGLAMAGKKVVFEVMLADWSTYPFDAIVNQMAKQRYISGGCWKFPITVRMPQGAGTTVGAHHSQSPEAWYTNVPGLKIVAPTTPRDVKGLMKAAIRGEDPVVFFEPKFAYGIPGEVPDEDYTVEIGKANVIKEGSDVTIIGWQYALTITQDMVEDLEDAGISCELIDLVSLVPYDKETILKSVKKTGRVVIVHEAPLRGGFGGEIAAFIAENAFSDLKSPIIRVGSKDCPHPCGPGEEYVMIDPRDIKKAVRKVVGK
jgi:acetoin:2,6-dichlorophenolindophenol oxidoreductase subunit beta